MTDQDHPVAVGDVVMWGSDGSGKVVALSEDGKTAFLRDWRGRPHRVRVDQLIPASKKDEVAWK